MARGNHQFRATQQHPMVVIPEPIYARIVIAAEEMNVSPGRWVELELREGLKRHGSTMNDADFERHCRQCERDMTASAPRWEFDKHRGKRMTDPK